MTPLLPTPDHYLFNLKAMTSADAKRLWKRAIKEHWSCQCAYCGETHDVDELTLDHVKPRTHGGSDLTSNLVPSCKKCNQAKGSNNWLTFLRQHFGYKPERELLIYSWIS